MAETGIALEQFAASIARTKFNVDSRFAAACCYFVDNSFSSVSLANASACLGGLRGAPPLLSG